MGSIEPYETASGRRYRVRFRNLENRQTDKRGFHTKRDAAEFLRSVETQKASGAYIAPTDARVTVTDWSKVWLATLVNLKATTRSGYEYSLSRHVLPRWGKMRLSDITHAHLQQWVAELAQSLAPSTVRQVFHVMGSMLAFAERDRRISRNPAIDIKFPRLTKSARGYLTHAQVRLLSEGAGTDADIIVTLAYTGLRWGELAALTVGNVDITLRRLNIIRSVSEVGGKLVISTPKNDKPRVVVFPRFLAPALERRMAGKSSDEQVFTTVNGAMLRNNNFRKRIFDPAVQAAREANPAFPRITPHDLRHTAASLAVSAGANIKAVQRMLGHSSAAMTLDVYADLFDEDLNAVSVALDRDAAPHFS